MLSRVVAPRHHSPPSFQLDCYSTRDWACYADTYAGPRFRHNPGRLKWHYSQTGRKNGWLPGCGRDAAPGAVPAPNITHIKERRPEDYSPKEWKCYAERFGLQRY